mmetsp:Transcript_60366/g.116424  ORF Transcript_60366/g.116424 Transcript_60366/m.116424 type:complete len:502 (+) Transcript_60366:109-1614(+)
MVHSLRTHGENEDEKSMQGLIRSSMMAMLQPVAEHVREIQEQTSQLAKSLATTNGKIDENKQHLNQQQQDLQAFRTCLAHTDSHVDRLQTDLVQTQREKDRLHSEHEVTKSDLTKVAGNLRGSNLVLKALQAKAENMDTDIGSLQGAAARTATKVQETQEKNAQLREFAENLSGHHYDLVREVAKVAHCAGTTDSALRKFIHSCEQTDKALQNEFARLDDHLNSLEGRLGKTQNHLIEVSDSYKALDATRKHPKSTYDNNESPHKMDAVQAPWDQNAQTLKEHRSDLNRLDKALAELSATVISNKDSCNSQVRNLESRIKGNAGALDSHNKQLQAHSEQIGKSDAQIARMQKSIEAMGEQADLLHADQQGLSAAQNQAANKQEIQRIALTKTQADLQQTNKEIQTIGKQIFALKDGMAETSKDMSKLSSRYDSCTRNILGMSKGFHDMSRHVSQGEHGLLQPKSARRLPELRGGSRAGSRAASPERGNSISDEMFDSRRFP